MAHVYISGPMTGMPDLNTPAFTAASIYLQSLGHTVIDPSITGVTDTMHIDDPRWVDYMVSALRRMESAEAICLLPGWDRSYGAQIERLNAMRRGIPIWSL